MCPECEYDMQRETYDRIVELEKQLLRAREERNALQRQCDDDGRLDGEFAELKKKIADDLDDLQFAKNGLKAVQGLIEESRGICGLHLNGDEAPWDELRTGGRFEEWLLDFDKAIEKLFPIAGKEGAE
jgi:hypothetical protein